MGLIKVDLLGLGMMAVLQDAFGSSNEGWVQVGQVRAGRAGGCSAGASRVRAPALP